jgi:hypothetical protein
MRVTFSPHQHLLFVFLMATILTGMRWNLTILKWGGISVWFWFTFPWWLRMLNIFNAFISHLYFFIWKMFSSFSRLLMDYVIYIYSRYYSHVGWIFCKDFLLFYRLSLQFIDCFSCCTETLNLIQSHLSMLPVVSWAFYSHLLPMPITSSVSPEFSPSTFKVSGLTLWCLVQSELIFVQHDRQGSSFSFLHVDIQFSQHTC